MCCDTFYNADFQTSIETKTAHAASSDYIFEAYKRSNIQLIATRVQRVHRATFDEFGSIVCPCVTRVSIYCPGCVCFKGLAS